jgi:hypothetical protein
MEKTASAKKNAIETTAGTLTFPEIIRNPKLNLLKKAEYLLTTKTLGPSTNLCYQQKHDFLKRKA